MADYYPVLKRAISSLPSTSGEARRAVYEKARQALLKQLQSYDPPLSPAEITDQRLQLEESIRRVESEVAGAAFGLNPEAAAPPVPPAQRVAPPPPAVPEPRPETPVAPPAPPPKPARPEPAKAEAPPPPPATVTVPKPAPAPLPPKPAVDAPSVPAEPQPDPKIGAGISALARTLRQAETLGDASAKAVRSARDAIEDAPEPAAPPPPDQKIEPGFLDKPLGAAVPEPVTEPPKRRMRAERDDTQVVPLPRHPEPKRPPVKRIAAIVLLLLLIGAAALAYANRATLVAMFADEPEPPAPVTAEVEPEAVAPDGLEPKILDRLPQNGENGTPVAPDAKSVTTERVTAPEPEPGVPPPPTAAAEPPAAPAAVEPPAAPAAVEPPPAAEPAAVEPPAAVADAGTPPGTETPPVAAEPSTEPPPPAIEPPPTTPSTSEPATPPPPAAAADGQPVVLVAQRAILYEEPIPGSEGARVDGQVLWSLVNEPVLPGEPPVPQVRATIDVPDRAIKLVVSLRLNSDKALPASHIAELRFDLGDKFSGGAIDTTPGLILKQTEDARGDPVIGAVAKVDDNLFWLALSGADQDATRNVALLKERQWVDVPIRYTNRRRAILTFEKGSPGEEVLTKAFAAWNQ